MQPIKLTGIVSFGENRRYYYVYLVRIGVMAVSPAQPALLRGREAATAEPSALDVRGPPIG
jgi:hypothetical protein